MNFLFIYYIWLFHSSHPFPDLLTFFLRIFNLLHQLHILRFNDSHLIILFPLPVLYLHLQILDLFRQPLDRLPPVLLPGRWAVNLIQEVVSLDLELSEALSQWVELVLDVLGCQVVRRDCVVLLREDQVTLEFYLLQTLGEILQVLLRFLEGDLLLTEFLV